MFLATFETLAEQEIQQVVCDLPDQMGGFGGQTSKEKFASSILFKFGQIPNASEDIEKEWLLFSLDQQSFHQLLKVVGENGFEWRAIVRKKHLGGTKRLQ